MKSNEVSAGWAGFDTTAVARSCIGAWRAETTGRRVIINDDPDLTLEELATRIRKRGGEAGLM